MWKLLWIMLLVACRPMTIDLPWKKDKKSNPPPVNELVEDLNSKGELFLRLPSAILSIENGQLKFIETTESVDIEKNRVHLLVDIPDANQDDANVSDYIFPSEIAGKGQLIISVERSDLEIDDSLKAVLPENFQLQLHNKTSVASNPRVDSIRDTKQPQSRTSIEGIDGRKHIGLDGQHPSIRTGVYEKRDGLGQVLYFEEIKSEKRNWLKDESISRVNEALTQVMTKLQIDGSNVEAVKKSYVDLGTLEKDQARKGFIDTTELEGEVKIAIPGNVIDLENQQFQSVVMTRFGERIYVDRWFGYQFEKDGKVIYATAQHRKKILNGKVEDQPISIRYEIRKEPAKNFMITYILNNQMRKAYSIAPDASKGDRKYVVALTIGDQLKHGFQSWAYKHRWLFFIGTIALATAATFTVVDFNSSAIGQDEDEVTIEEQCLVSDWSLPACKELLEKVKDAYGLPEENQSSTDTTVTIPIPDESPKDDDKEPGDILTQEPTEPVAQSPFQTTPIEGVLKIKQGVIGHLLNATTGEIDAHKRMEIVAGEYSVTGLFLKAEEIAEE